MAEEEQTKPEVKDEPQKPVSPVEEIKAIHKEIMDERKGLKEENDRKEKIQADDYLSGTSGGHVEAKEVKEETNKEYVDKMRANGWKADA